MDRQEQDPTAHSPPLNFHQDYPEFVKYFTYFNNFVHRTSALII